MLQILIYLCVAYIQHVETTRFNAFKDIVVARTIQCKMGEGGRVCELCDNKTVGSEHTFYSDLYNSSILDTSSPSKVVVVVDKVPSMVICVV